MSKFNTTKTTTKTATAKAVTSAVKSSSKAAVNANGGDGFERKNKSELFLLAVANFVGQDTFYENAKNRDDRFSSLCRKVAVKDKDWFLGFVGWLRNDSFMRSASVVAAVEGAKAVLDAKQSSVGVNYPRRFIRAAQARADEPGEILAYWMSRYGTKIPAAVKKGVADGANALYNEYSLLKYDTPSKGLRFSNVIQLSHAKAKDFKQNELFSHALDRAYGNDSKIPDILTMVASRANLYSAPVEQRKKLLGTKLGRDQLSKAGITWEALAGWLQGPMDAQAWEAVIPNMGYMALLRNLRNFDQAGISDSAKDYVIAKLQNKDEVAKSKQFPFRFLSAYQANQHNETWSSALKRALDHSLVNLPELPGKTLILVDRSGSMFTQHGGLHEMSRADTAALFGTALALRAEDATLVQYGSAWNRQASSEVVQFKKTDSVLAKLSQFKSMGGTDTALAIKTHFKGHDRVILITDEQENYYRGGNASGIVPKDVPLYTWNLAGYAIGGKAGSDNRHTFGGLTDKAFVQIPMIEAGQNAVWPWELDSKE